MTIPDEAVQAFKSEFHTKLGIGYDENIRRALTAALPFLQGVKVKALAWRDVDAVCAWCYAKTIVGEYSVTWTFHVEGNRLNLPDGTSKQCDDLEAAKAAAQADYEARILSAIEPAPSPRAQALEEAVRNACMYLDTGFIECPKCGEEVETKHTDAEYALRRALSSQPVADGWLPIETAPIGNGSNRFLAYITGHGPCVCFRTSSGSVYSVDGRHILRATHWRPLPASPGAPE